MKRTSIVLLSYFFSIACQEAHFHDHSRQVLLCGPRRRSISAAARALHVAQPPICDRSPNEAELGVQHCARESRGIIPRRTGALYRQEPLAFPQSPARGGECPQHRRRRGRRASTSASSTPAMPYALPLFGAYHARYPKVEFYAPSRFPAEWQVRRAASSFCRSAAGPAACTKRILGDALEAHHDRATDARRGRTRRAHRAAAHGVPVLPAALGRSLGLGLSDEGVPPQQPFEPNVPCQCYDRPWRCSNALGLRHQLSAALHRRTRTPASTPSSARHPISPTWPLVWSDDVTGATACSASSRNLTGAALLKN